MLNIFEFIKSASIYIKSQVKRRFLSHLQLFDFVKMRNNLKNEEKVKKSRNMRNKISLIYLKSLSFSSFSSSNIGLIISPVAYAENKK